MWLRLAARPDSERIADTEVAELTVTPYVTDLVDRFDLYGTDRGHRDGVSLLSAAGTTVLPHSDELRL